VAADATIGRWQATPPVAVPEPWCELEPVTATGGDPLGGYGTPLVLRAAFADAAGRAGANGTVSYPLLR